MQAGAVVRQGRGPPPGTDALALRHRHLPEATAAAGDPDHRAGLALLAADDREALAARAFQELSRLLESSASASAVRATVTIQTPQGLELCWINDLEPGRKLLHGEDE